MDHKLGSDGSEIDVNVILDNPHTLPKVMSEETGFSHLALHAKIPYCVIVVIKALGGWRVRKPKSSKAGFKCHGPLLSSACFLPCTRQILMVRYIFSFCTMMQESTQDEGASWDRHGLCLGAGRCGPVLGEVVWKSPPCFCPALKDGGGEEDPT